jgi:hypothetical protein
MTFFYNLNDKLNAIREKPETTHKQLNERDMSRAAKGYEKYGKEGMEALAKAGREGKALDPVRAKYDKYDNTEVDEGAHSQDAMALNPDFDKIGRKPGVMGKIGSGIKKVADVIAPGDDELLDRLQKSSGAATRQPGAKEPRYMEAMSPAKQKSFAALAPPKDKITFADKIAGAKKEVDEMLGDVAAEAMKSALGKGKQPVRGMGEATKEIPGGRRHTSEPGGYGRKDDDDAPRVQTQRGRGRPKKNADSDTGQVMKPDFSAFGVTGKDIKLPKHKGAVTKHKMVGEDDLDPKDPGEYDQEGDMAKDTIKTVVRHAQALEKILGNNDNLPEWVQSKLAKIESMMTAVDDYMQNQADDDMDMDDDQEPIAEKAVSKKQQRFMGMVSAAKKGEKPASKEVAKVAKTMKKSDAEDFARTKHKGLPEKAEESDSTTDSSKKVSKRSAKPEEKVEETTVSGSVATAPAAGGKKSSGGFAFGGGIYDSMNRDLENMISESMSRLDESMSINMSMNNDEHGGPTRSLTVTATDDDAMKLSQLLRSAGLGGGDEGYGGSGYKSACGCGTPDCSCGEQQMHEVSMNQPDYPTNTETSDDALQYSGGLNKPKSTGQTTVPVIASQEERQDSYADMEEDALQRMMEMSGIREAKAKPDFLDMDKDGNKQEPMKKAVDDKKTKVQEADTEFNESIRRMREIAGLDKKAVDEEKTEEGNLFTEGLADDNIKVGDKIPGTNATKTKDIDESIFALTNQWKAYKG